MFPKPTYRCLTTLKTSEPEKNTNTEVNNPSPVWSNKEAKTFKEVTKNKNTAVNKPSPAWCNTEVKPFEEVTSVMQRNPSLTLDCINAFGVVASTYGTQKWNIGRKDAWHKFTVMNGSYFDKDEVLQRILEVVNPLDLVPVMYSVDGINTCFLARNCGPAIEKLCRMRLSVPNLGSRPNFILKIELAFALTTEIRVNMQENLLKCMIKHYNSKTKALDLSNFHKDPDLWTLMYCPLSQPRILQYAVNTAKLQMSGFTYINLSNNDISIGRSLEGLASISGLKTLDLSNNKLDNVADLEVLKSSSIANLFLDGNPLCGQYADGTSYASDVKKAIPSILKLDGCPIHTSGCPCLRRNFVLDESHVPLIDKFLEHYFTLYDGDNRNKLRGVYHEDALFSMTASFLPGQSTSASARLTQYMMESRNLMKLSDYQKGFKLLHHGEKDILTTLCKLPRSEHDPSSFSVVQLTSMPHMTTITVAGLFREQSATKPTLIRSFSRVFVLMYVGHCEYKIINETLFVSNATTQQSEKGFKIRKPLPTIAKNSPKLELRLTDMDKDQMCALLSNISTMNARWARKFLEDAMWHMDVALQTFAEMYSKSIIPAVAFDM